MRRVRDYGLSLTLAALFLVSWGVQAIVQIGIVGETWPEFWAATFENWQSEFLQLLTFVVLTSSLIHRGSHESKDGDEEMKAALKRVEDCTDDMKAQLDRIERQLDPRIRR